MPGVSSAMGFAAVRAGDLRVVATGLERENGEGGEVAELTGVSSRQSARSGMS